MSVAEVTGAIRILRKKHVRVLINGFDPHDLITLIDRAHELHEGRVILRATAEQLMDGPAVGHIHLGESFAL